MPAPFGTSQPPTTFRQSLGFAWSGLVHTVVQQRNMRMHLLAAVLVGQVGCGLALGLAEKVTLLVCVLLVIFAEMLNTALEQLVDLVTQAYDERARLAKDVAAAGVLVLAGGTVVIFAAVLVENAGLVLASLEDVQRQVLVGVPLTLAVGLLMHESRRPAWVDLVVALAGFGLWAWELTWTRSFVFSALTGGLLVLALAASRARRALGPGA
jgi:diacylglycerol kinase (ATP)